MPEMVDHRREEPVEFRLLPLDHHENPAIDEVFHVASHWKPCGDSLRGVAKPHSLNITFVIDHTALKGAWR